MKVIGWRTVSFTDWITALHVLSAFAVVGALVFFWALYFAPAASANSGPLMSLGRLGNAVVGVGMGGTLVLGVWLAVAREPYQLWDVWVIAAFVLWAAMGATGQRAGALAQAGNLRESMKFHAATSVLAVLMLIDMIWKPWA
jgi:hypothetical protein